MTPEKTLTRLQEHLPSGSYVYVRNLLETYQIHFKISRPRKTKLGDYRYDPKTKINTITVNEDLNTYAFLITLIHEIAHFLQFKNNRRRRVQPHGIEWKVEFKTLMDPLLQEAVFPVDIADHLFDHLINPTASSCADVTLMRLLEQYNTEQTLKLESIPEGALFTINNTRVYKKGAKQRTRFKCTDIATNRTWFVHAMAAVEIVE